MNEIVKVFSQVQRAQSIVLELRKQFSPELVVQLYQTIQAIDCRAAENERSSIEQWIKDAKETMRKQFPNQSF